MLPRSMVPGRGSCRHAIEDGPSVGIRLRRDGASGRCVDHGRADADVTDGLRPVPREFLHDLSSNATHRSRSGLSTSRAADLEEAYRRQHRPLGNPRPLELSLLPLPSGCCATPNCRAWRSPLRLARSAADHEFGSESLRPSTIGSRFNPVGRSSCSRSVAPRCLIPALFRAAKVCFVLPLDVWLPRRLSDQITTDAITDRALCESVGLNAVPVARLWSATRRAASGLYWSPGSGRIHPPTLVSPT